MQPIDYAIILVIAAIVTLCVLHIAKAKKRGDKCIGCPYSKACGGNCGEMK